MFLLKQKSPSLNSTIQPEVKMMKRGLSRRLIKYGKVFKKVSLFPMIQAGNVRDVFIKHIVMNGSGGNVMENIIRTAQNYLITRNNGVSNKIVNIEHLIKNHSIESIINLLEQLLRERKKILKNLICKEDTTDIFDRSVIVIFRIQMALNKLKEMEVKEYGSIKQRTGEGR